MLIKKTLSHIFIFVLCFFDRNRIFLDLSATVNPDQLRSDGNDVPATVNLLFIVLNVWNMLSFRVKNAVFGKERGNHKVRRAIHIFPLFEKYSQLVLQLNLVVFLVKIVVIVLKHEDIFFKRTILKDMAHDRLDPKSLPSSHQQSVTILEVHCKVLNSNILDRPQ